MLPLATHGVFFAGSTTETAVPSTVVEYAKILATNVQAALERLEREERLKEREAALEAQTDSLERLDRLNAMIRDIAQAIVHATTRTEIGQTVCDRLAAADRVRFAWIGTHDALARTLGPRAWAGVDCGFLDSVTITTDEGSTERGPAGTAAHTRET